MAAPETPTVDAARLPRRRRTRTREALLAATRRLMTERPRESFTIDDVVQAADVAKGSFYNHFADKEALIGAVYADLRDKEEAEVGAANADVADPVDRLARGMATYARLALVSPEEACIIAQTRLDGLLRAASRPNLLEDLRAGLRDGRLALPSVEVGALLMVGQGGVLMTRLRGLTAAAAMPIAQQMIAVTMAGLGLDHRQAHLVAAQAVDYSMRDLA